MESKMVFPETGQYNNNRFPAKGQESLVSFRQYFRQQEISPGSFLSLAVQLSEILSRLHREGMVLGNLNPDILLVNREDHTVHLADLSQKPGTDIDLQNIYYLAPEQTGRLNRTVDLRADLFSMGVIFYEALTGRLPVKGNNELEWFHNLMAKNIKPPHQVDKHIPAMISRIVMKCLQRDPDDRYQSAEGIRRDLSRCLEEWERRGKLTSFEIGQHDLPSLSTLSEGFYGRERELAILHDSFARASQGQTEIVFISGQAGIGKTRLIRKFSDQIRKKQGFFISGKFRPLLNEAPYGPIIEAFNNQLLQRLLSCSQEEVAAWSKLILYRVGSNISLLVALVPHLERLVGKQPEVDVASSLEARERLFYAFYQALQVFAREGAPLVLFLDDLHWADPGSLKILEALILEHEIRNLMFIGAYREEEVPAEHILAKTIRTLDRHTNKPKTIRLAPFESDQVEKYIADSLFCSGKEARPLARFVHQKTGGNPLFVRELIHTMYKKELIIPGSTIGNWFLREIKHFTLADDIAGFLAERIQLLSGPSERLLQFAACIGYTFDALLLAEISDQPVAIVEEHLRECVNEGLIQKTGEQVYSFLHDRVHQAAYSLMPDEEKKIIHYRLGFLMLEEEKKNPEQKQGIDQGYFFLAVNHLNLGQEYVIRNNQRIEGARWNLLAGKRAKQAFAFNAALNYLQTGLELLPEYSWETDYSLTFELYLEYLECLYLCGQGEKAGELYHSLLDRVADKQDRTKLHIIEILFANKNNFNFRAIEVGLQGLRELGHDLPAKPSWFYIARKLIKVKRMVKRIGIDRILELPPAKDRKVQAVFEILMAISPCTYNNDWNLFSTIVLHICELSLRHGYFNHSSSGYISLAMIDIIRLKDFKTGIPLGKTALALEERNKASDKRYVFNFLYGAFFLPWLEHAKQGEMYLEKAMEGSLISRDFVYAGYSMSLSLVSKHFRGLQLSELAKQIEEYLQLSSKVKEPYFTCFLTIYKQMINNLQGLTRDPDRFSDDTFAEEDLLREDGDYRIREKELFDYYLLKSQVRYIMGNYKQALAMLKEAERLKDLYFGEIYLADHAFYYYLTVTAAFPALTWSEKASYIRLLWKKLRQMRHWTQHCPANFEHKYLLMAAEMARLCRQKLKAALLYDQAIRSAREYGFIHNTAIASECAAKFYDNLGLADLAHKYIEGAYEEYCRWGATQKTDQLRSRYPWLAEKAEKQTQASKQGAAPGLTNRDLSKMVDMEAILRVNQLLSGEIILEDLLKRLMETVVQNAGASRGALLLYKNQDLFIEALLEIKTNSTNIDVLLSLPLDECIFLPRSVVHYVARTGETVILDNAAETGVFADDPYISGNLVSSVLCLPLVGKGKTVGVLYLENNMSTGAFTADELETLRLLSSQIAISLENARLYADLKQSRDRLSEWTQTLEETVAERTRELQQINEQLMRAKETADAANRAKSDFLAVISHEIRTSLHGIVGMAELLLQTPLDPEEREYAATILESSELLLVIINDILDLRRIEEGKLNIESVDFNLPELEKKPLSAIAFKASRKEITLKSYLEPGIPALLRGDPVRLSQVLLNLLNNAVKFTEQGRITLRITMVNEESDYLNIRFEVQDTGIGIPEQAQPFIFQPFFQDNSAISHRHSGSGLGLAICKRLVELMQGRIGFESVEGCGTTFWFTVPLLRSNAKAETVETNETKVLISAAATHLEGKDKSGTVLVVDDNIINQKVIISQLKKLGISAKTASNGKEAVDAYSQASYSLIFMDCQMPLMNGYEATTVIRSMDSTGQKRTPIVATSAGLVPGEEEKCLSEGMDDYLRKPIRMEDLQKVLARWLPDYSIAAAEGAHIATGEENKIIDCFAAAFVDAAFRDGFKEIIGGDMNFLLDLIETFLQDMPTKMAALRKANKNKDAATLRLKAHGMKSNSKLLGLTGLAELCQKLEDAATACELTSAGEIIRETEAVYKQIKNKMQDFLKNAKQNLA